MELFQKRFKERFIKNLEERTAWGRTQLKQLFAETKSDISFELMGQEVDPKSFSFFKRFEKRFLDSLYEGNKSNWGRNEVRILFIQQEADEALASVESYNTYDPKKQGEADETS